MIGLKTAHENDFVDCSWTELSQFCDMLEVAYEEEDEADVLRGRLKAALREYIETIAPQVVGEAPTSEEMVQELKIDVPKLTRLNLRSPDGWAGRRRRIVLNRSLDHNDTKHPQFFGFNGLQCYVPYGKIVDIPWPIWEILKVTNERMAARQERKQSPAGQLYFDTVWYESPRFMVTDMQTTPDTEHLPRDIHDQWRMIYHATNKFDGWGIARWKELGRRLKIRGAADMDAETIKRRVKFILGIAQEDMLGVAPERTAKAG